MELTIKNCQKKIPIPRAKIARAARLALNKFHCSSFDLSIVCVGRARMRRLNKEYLGHDYVTDVITFDYKEAGEIIVCPSVAKANAKRYKVSLDRELILYVVHGILHLAGYDDHKPNDAARMRVMENNFFNL